jgi:hypothetical protein
LLEVCRVWRAFVECGVRPLSAVEADTIVDDPFGLEAIGHFMQIDSLLFRGPPGPLDKDTIQIATAPVHGDFNLSVGQCRDPISACILHIGCPDPCSRSLAIRVWRWLFPKFHTDAGIQRV